MNQVCKIASSLLNGEAISILTGFQKFFITNVPREIGRSIERKFLVKIDKRQKNFVNADGESGYYFEYRLLYNKENAEGIERMKAYVSEHTQSDFSPKIKRGAKKVNMVEQKPHTPPKNNSLQYIQNDLFTL